MAILRSSDGKFYDVADDQLEDKMIPAEQIKERLDEVGVGPAPGPVGPGPEMTVPGTGGQVVIQIYTSGAEAGGYGPAPEGEAEGVCRNCGVDIFPPPLPVFGLALEEKNRPRASDHGQRNQQRGLRDELPGVVLDPIADRVCDHVCYFLRSVPIPAIGGGRVPLVFHLHCAYGKDYDVEKKVQKKGKPAGQQVPRHCHGQFDKL